MSRKRIIDGKVLRQNYRELVFVFAAFALMAMVGYFFIGHILRVRLLSGAEEMLYTAEANIRAGLSEAETALINSYYVLESMEDLHATKQDILDYFTITTDWMRRREQGLIDYYGIYGFINGEFFDSMGFSLAADYVPQKQPWYQTAIRSGRNIAYTAPYEDALTGDMIISAVRNIDIQNGDIFGILSVDINIKWLQEYVGSLKLAKGGYSMLLNRGMAVVTHPDISLVGNQLEDLGKSYDEAARILRAHGEVFARRITDINGNSAIMFIRHIFNGWYVCVITPYIEFYRDLYISAGILVILGIILSLLLCFILLRFSAAKARADEDNKSKSSFLASMSHEIRTPMNAITGMAELLLRIDLSDEARSYARDIKHAGNNLVSLINDILDFSKIEAGRLEIFPVKYMLASLINDSVNIIRMRIGEKPLRFFTNIDSNIPNNLIGDEARLRQILLNLLSNAVKYSEKGYIGLTITMQKMEDKQVWLRISVEDTGRGIKREDLEKLFGEFVQVDTNKNRGIEGTGLGLAITRKLCILMGGSITVESEYGKGSVFTVVLPQDISSPEPFAAVENPEKKKVLVYESREIYKQAICWSLENMKVPFSIVTFQNDFKEALLREEWYYIFSGYGLYHKIKPVMESIDSFPGGKKPPLALLTEWGMEEYMPNVRFLSIPVQSLSIANTLNGVEDDKGFAESTGIIRFCFPTARLLVVDDIATNLKVAEGLLAPYKVKVDTCLSGRQSVEKAKNNAYDIILMDHMMPDMDGIEATAIIRAWEEEQQKNDPARSQTPIIALTANAVVGMRETFLQCGFNDFLAKPIDVSKLDEILNHWIPKEKRAKISRPIKPLQQAQKAGTIAPPEALPEGSELFSIPGVDTVKGISLTGGTVATYKQVLSLYCKDVEERLPLLEKMLEDDNLNMLITHVHAMKSASASIGAAEMAAQAANIEAVGKAGDKDFIQNNLGAFIQQFRTLIDGIKEVLNADREENKDVQTTDIPEEQVTLLRRLKTALESQKTTEMDTVLEELNNSADSVLQPLLEHISDNILVAEYKKAIDVIDGLLRERSDP